MYTVSQQTSTDRTVQIAIYTYIHNYKYVIMFSLYFDILGYVKLGMHRYIRLRLNFHNC